MSTKAHQSLHGITVIGIDIGKDVFHLVGFAGDGQVVLRRKIRRLALTDVFKTLPRCERLMSVPGIGPMISTAMVAAIGSGEAFDRGRDFAAWLGLVPRQYSTGGKPILGRITKRGCRYLRTLFIQAAHIILMRPHNWTRFSFGVWLERASQRMHKNKLAAALANKLARIAWSVLRSGKPFDAHRVEVTAI